MRLPLTAACLALAALATAQGKPVRIPVRHADPWSIKAMIEGLPVASPELSAVIIGNGPAQSLAAAINAAKTMLQSGRLIVNGADNSLWWFPDRPTT